MMRYPFLDLAKVNAPYIEELQRAVSQVVVSGRYIGGPEVEALESEMAEIIGVSHVVAVSNGLDALRLILRAYIEMGRLRPGDGVIVPADTYIASVLAVSDSGLRPVLAEPSPTTANLTAETIANAYDPGVKAVMPVHLYGRVAWDEEIKRLVDDLGLLVVEDAAQAIGAVSQCVGRHGDSRHAGALGDAAGFSFYPTKNVGALGDAGAVTTDDGELAQVVRALANYGSDCRYHNVYQGFNCRMDPIQAAVLRVKLHHLDEENLYRRELASVYNAMITNELVELPPFVDDYSMVWHQYTVQVDDRDRFRSYMADNGVGTDANYPCAVHQQPCYQALAAIGSLPVAERLCSRVVSLPITRTTTPADAHVIASIINRYH